MPTHLSPAQAWTALQEGNARFVGGAMEHPSQDAGRRTEVSASQHPFAVIFGCSDSRVAAEIVFDQGLGDLFVVRTAGHVADATVLGSIEFGVLALGAPLVVVLGHDSCGAVGAAAHALTTGEVPSGFVRAVVDRVIPSIVTLADPGGDGDGPRRLAVPDAATLGREHVRSTVTMLQGYSVGLREAIDEGRVAIVGLEYALADGRVEVVAVAGDVGP